VSKCPLLIRTPIRLDQCPPCRLPISLFSSLETPSQVQSHSEMLGIKASVYEFWSGTQFSPVTSYQNWKIARNRNRKNDFVVLCTLNWGSRAVTLWDFPLNIINTQRAFPSPSLKVTCH
jgi:hypothetical protein